MPTYEQIQEQQHKLRVALSRELSKLAYGWDPNVVRRVNEFRQRFQAATELLKLMAEHPDIV